MNEDQKTWDIFFASVCSIQFHPRNEITNYVATIAKSALIADLMIEERKKHALPSSS